jgi:hypothetical protein
VRISIASKQEMRVMMPIIEERVPMSWRSEVMQRRRLGWFFTLVDAVMIDREALIDRAVLELNRLGVEVHYDALLIRSQGRRDLAIGSFVTLILSTSIGGETFNIFHRRLSRLGWSITLDEVQGEDVVGLPKKCERALAARI